MPGLARIDLLHRIKLRPPNIEVGMTTVHTAAEQASQATSAAASGTLFRDEIGELAEEQQRKLLRVLQTRYYSRVGETQERELTARIVIATNRDLRKEVKERRFREDLFFRIANYAIELPPLR